MLVVVGGGLGGVVCLGEFFLVVGSAHRGAFPFVLVDGIAVVVELDVAVVFGAVVAGGDQGEFSVFQAVDEVVVAVHQAFGVAQEVAVGDVGKVQAVELGDMDFTVSVVDDAAAGGFAVTDFYDLGDTAVFNVDQSVAGLDLGVGVVAKILKVCFLPGF